MIVLQSPPQSTSLRRWQHGAKPSGHYTRHRSVHDRAFRGVERLGAMAGANCAMGNLPIRLDFPPAGAVQGRSGGSLHLVFGRPLREAVHVIGGYRARYAPDFCVPGRRECGSRGNHTPGLAHVGGVH